MEPKILQFLFFSAGLGGLALSGILISSRKYFAQNFFLSLCVFSLSVSSIYNFCYGEKLLDNLPFFFVFAKSCPYLIAPSAYLYIRNIFDSEKAYKQFDWVHFVPFSLALVILSNISLQNPLTIQKIFVDRNWFENISQVNIYYALIISKFALWLIYSILQSLCIINFERKKNPIYKFNYRLINWVKIFNINIILLFILVSIQRIFELTFISLDFINDITVSIILLTTISFLITRPHILYGLESANVNVVTEKVEIINPKPKNNSTHSSITKSKPLFDYKKKEEYMLILNQVLEEEKPYLNKGITVKDLSEQTGIPSHHLSYLINIEFNLHFQDFINLNRIEYLKSKVDDKDWKQLTLEGICWDIGFTSRTTFFRAFVKLTGVSPSEYFRGIKKNNTA